MHTYRTHNCGELRKQDVGRNVRVSGWVHRIRDHGGLLFVDLRDHYGLTQCVADPQSPAFAAAEKLSRAGDPKGDKAWAEASRRADELKLGETELPKRPEALPQD